MGMKTTRKEREARAALNRSRRAQGEEVFDTLGRPVPERASVGGTSTVQTLDSISELLVKELTESVAKDMIGYCAKGAFPHHAAAQVGVPIRIFREWQAQAKRGVEPYATTIECMITAQQGAISKASLRLLEAGDKGIWQADARYLESAAASEYMRTEKRLNENAGEAFKGILEELKDLRKKPEEKSATPLLPAGQVAILPSPSSKPN